MKIKNVSFLKSCTSVSQFPHYPYPEFAFLGRSNVGKSSLINMLMRKKDLVKTGSMPGVTKTVNFFILNDGISIADLPGFGYAKVPMAIKKAFLPLIKNYIEKRENLKLAFLLIDIRRTPDHYEEDLISLLAKRRIPTVIALTKCDKLSRNSRIRQIKIISETLGVLPEVLFLTSAKAGDGRRDMLKLIEEYSGQDGAPNG